LLFEYSADGKRCNDVFYRMNVSNQRGERNHLNAQFFRLLDEIANGILFCCRHLRLQGETMNQRGIVTSFCQADARQQCILSRTAHVQAGDDVENFSHFFNREKHGSRMRNTCNLFRVFCVFRSFVPSTAHRYRSYQCWKTIRFQSCQDVSLLFWKWLSLRSLTIE